MKYNTYKKIRALVLIATIAFFAASAINGMVGLFDSISATAASAASARMDNDVMLNIIIYIYAVASGLVAIIARNCESAKYPECISVCAQSFLG